MGESLARLELFLFITYFFQAFEFHLCSDPAPSLSANPDSGLIKWPCPYNVRLQHRLNG